MKRWLLGLIAVMVVLLFSAFPVYAADYTPQAETLKDLGLFLGSDNGFELEREATRAESAAMVVRLLGQETTAQTQKNSHPFTDVPVWASDYVGYLYQNNITKGVSDTQFGSNNLATATQYATYMLRALQYDDTAGDFTWDKALDTMATLGILTREEANTFAASPAIPRGDMVAISYASLFATPKGLDICLLEKLYSVDQAIQKQQLQEAATDVNVAAIANLHGIPAVLPEGNVLSSEEIYAAASDAVFMIESKNSSDEEDGSGSGFFISPDGIAVTNFHVLAYASSGTITTANQQKFEIEGVLAFEPNMDLVIIKVKGDNFTFLPLGDPTLLRSAQRIYCIGSPYGLDNTISDGLVSNVSRDFEGQKYIQISAPIAPGSSGGALLNEYGQVVGVTAAGLGEANLNLAVPITDLQNVQKFATLRSLQYFQAHIRFGVVPFGFDQQEQGDNDTNAVQTLTNDNSLRGTVSSNQDVDVYTIKVGGSGDLLISVTSDTAHSENLKFELLNSASEVVASSQHYSGEVFSCAMGYTARSGEYTLRVFVEGGSQTWSETPYEVYYYWQETVDFEEDYLSYLFEFEPNNTLGQADYLPLHWFYRGSISNVNDTDYIMFTIDKKGNYGIFLEQYVENSGFECEVFDASTNKSVGKLEYDDDYWLGVLAAELDAGDYYLVVTPKKNSAGWEESYYDIAVLYFGDE